MDRLQIGVVFQLQEATFDGAAQAVGEAEDLDPGKAALGLAHHAGGGEPIGLLTVAVEDGVQTRSALPQQLTAAPLCAQPDRTVTVYKEATCGGWARYMTKAGFAGTAVNVSNIAAIKTKYGIPDALATCHTAEVDGYLVEGHVPAVVVERLLRERPKAPLGVP